MDVLEEISFMINHIVVISWDMHLLHNLLYIGIQIKLLLSTDHIMCSLINITPACPLIKITHWGPYNFNGIQKKNPLWNYRQLGLITFKIDLSKTPFTESTIVQYQLGITT